MTDSEAVARRAHRTLNERLRRQRNPERIRALQADWRQNNRDKIKVSNQQTYQKHRERRLSDERGAYRKDPSKKRQAAKMYAINNRELVKDRRTDARARRKGLPFDRSKPRLLCGNICPITKEPFRDSTRAGDPYTRSVDRRDNTQGYIKGNKFYISARANSLKADMTPEDIREAIVKTKNQIEHLGQNVVLYERLLQYMEGEYD